MLPKIETPTYSLTLPISKKKVKYRPFLVGEQKVILMAMELGDETSIYEAVKTAIGNCTFNKVNASELTVLDFEILFMHIRAKSAGEEITLDMRCEAEGCSGLVPLDVNLMEVKHTPVPKREFTVSPGIMMRLRFPSIDEIREVENSGAAASSDLFRMVYLCLEGVFTEESVTSRNDVTEKEFQDWFNTVPTPVVDELELFFQNIPHIDMVVKSKCLKCGKDHSYRFSGLEDFFS